MRYQRAESPALLNGFEAAHGFFKSCFSADDRSEERLWVAHLDEAARCIHLERYDGDKWSADVPIRSIISDAARIGSAGIVLAHNHPSGDPTPSQADCRATRALAMAAEHIDLVVVDHLIFARARRLPQHAADGPALAVSTTRLDRGRFRARRHRLE